MILNKLVNVPSQRHLRIVTAHDLQMKYSQNQEDQALDHPFQKIQKITHS